MNLNPPIYLCNPYLRLYLLIAERERGGGGRDRLNLDLLSPVCAPLGDPGIKPATFWYMG